MTTSTPPPSQLSKLRCARHPEREAAARCASCGLVFCRECVSEHNGRFLCAACLAKIVAAENASAARRPRAAIFKRALAIAAGAAWLWLCLYLTGLLIEKIPQSFHEGTIWRQEEPGTTAGMTADTVAQNGRILDFGCQASRFARNWILDCALPRGTEVTMERKLSNPKSSSERSEKPDIQNPKFPPEVSS